ATLGFALGGFFDGILLHQILQWHHLLSGLDGPRWRSLPVQVMADGLFHALMYVIALAGLWMLWKGRRAAALVTRQRFLGQVAGAAPRAHERRLRAAVGFAVPRGRGVASGRRAGPCPGGQEHWRQKQRR